LRGHLSKKQTNKKNPKKNQKEEKKKKGGTFVSLTCSQQDTFL